MKVVNSAWRSASFFGVCTGVSSIKCITHGQAQSCIIMTMQISGLIGISPCTVAPHRPPGAHARGADYGPLVPAVANSQGREGGARAAGSAGGRARSRFGSAVGGQIGGAGHLEAAAHHR